MQTYLLVDSANLFFRSRHSVNRSASAEDKVGMALHITINSVNAMVRRFGADHVVWCLEGRSWRKDFYEPYKRNRQEAKNRMTPREVEEDQMFWDTYDSLVQFVSEKTNCSVLRCPTAEADDLIARWISLHPDDRHIIISSDTDFHQLLSPTVTQYNGVSDELFTLEGIYNSRDKLVVDKKTREPKQIPDPQWILFEKIMRGDSSDNVFSAYPGVRTKGSKNKVGLLEAYEDRHRQGWAWNNLMLQRWTDHEGVEHRVLDDYNRNRILIDLTAQPEEVTLTVDSTIREHLEKPLVLQIGIKFLKFCGKYNLVKLSEQADNISKWMSNSYSGILNDSNSKSSN